MSFKTMSEVETYMVSKMSPALLKTEEIVYQVISRFVKEYYAEYTPTFYERTYQLYKSLVKSEIVKVGNGYRVEIYFDIDKLDYHIKHFTKIKTDDGLFVNPFNFKTSPNGEFPNPKGNAELVLDSAMHGTHGGIISGTAIWDESSSVLNRDALEILKRMLISEGLPVR